MLSFRTRTVGDVTIIDWSMAGGQGCRPASDVEVECLRRIAELEAALRKINALIDSPARFNADVQLVLDSVIDTSDIKHT